jgi:xylulokinase
VRVLAIDLGTSRVKVGVVDETLTTVKSASRTYETVSDDAGMAEQRTDDWLNAIREATLEALSGAGPVDGVVLTAQMPTLVSLSSTGQVLGNAVTWQDTRADDLVTAQLSTSNSEGASTR